MLAVSLCLLGACSGSVPADLPAPPASLAVPCALPVTLPDRDATQAEAEHWWGRDRSALRNCAARHDGLVAWAEGQRAAGR